MRNGISCTPFRTVRLPWIIALVLVAASCPKSWGQESLQAAASISESLDVADFHDEPYTDFGDRNPGEEYYIADGFVFLNGRYVSPPYMLRMAEGKVTINGQAVDYPIPEPLEDHGGWGSRRQRRMKDRPLHQLASELHDGSILVAFPGFPVSMIHHPSTRVEMLRLFTEQGQEEELPPDVLESLPPEQHEAWTRWMLDYQPPDDLQQRAALYVEDAEALSSSNWASVGAVRRMDKLAYPLTLLGMVGVVMGFGHLLLHRPGVDGSTERIDTSPAAMRLVTRSMMLVVVLSGLDLVWTILASQAGQMRELNPLGSLMIQDPVLLTVFKATITAMSVGLLLALRKHRPAQVASWWACLICTLLTVRWLVFNSMFVA